MTKRRYLQISAAIFWAAITALASFDPSGLLIVWLFFSAIAAGLWFLVKGLRSAK